MLTMSARRSERLTAFQQCARGARLVANIASFVIAAAAAAAADTRGYRDSV